MKKTCSISVVPDVGKYSSSQVFIFIWELQAAGYCMGPDLDPSFIFLKAFFVGGKIV